MSFRLCDAAIDQERSSIRHDKYQVFYTGKDHGLIIPLMISIQMCDW
jgi:hypothetical protein